MSIEKWETMSEHEILKEISCYLNRDGGQTIDSFGLIPSLVKGVMDALRVFQEKDTKERKDTKKVCPKCGSANVGQTYVDYMGGEDLNNATCECGWHGKVKDMKENGNE